MPKNNPPVTYPGSNLERILHSKIFEMLAFAYIAAYSTLIVFGSLLGGMLPTIMTLTHTRMQLIVSFVGGLMLGIGLLHMLPHGQWHLGSLDQAVLWMIGGLLAMFFLIRVFHFHQHGTAETSGTESLTVAHDSIHDHGSHHHKLSWAGVATGLAIHTLIDGLALGAAVLSESGSMMPGFSVFVVILLHKPLDALSITSLMSASGWSVRARQGVNLAFAVMCPLGAAIFVRGVGVGHNEIIGAALAFSAGVFVCISLGDLLPEVHFHTHDRLKLSVALLSGIAMAYGIGLLEHHGHDRHDAHPTHNSLNDVHAEHPEHSRDP